VSGIGSTGSFQLMTPFYPSPAILAGDTSDSEEEEEDSDDEPKEYVPRPTKRGRLAVKKGKTSAAPPEKKKAAPSSGGGGKNARAAKRTPVK